MIAKNEPKKVYMCRTILSLDSWKAVWECTGSLCGTTRLGPCTDAPGTRTLTQTAVRTYVPGCRASCSTLIRLSVAYCLSKTMLLRKPKGNDQQRACFVCVCCVCCWLRYVIKIKDRQTSRQLNRVNYFASSSST